MRTIIYGSSQLKAHSHVSLVAIHSHMQEIYPELEHFYPIENEDGDVHFVPLSSAVTPRGGFGNPSLQNSSLSWELVDGLPYPIGHSSVQIGSAYAVKGGYQEAVGKSGTITLLHTALRCAIVSVEGKDFCIRLQDVQFHTKKEESSL